MRILVSVLYYGKEKFNPLRTFERCRWLCEKGHLTFMETFTTAHLGFAYALQGRLDEGITLLDQALEESASKGMMFCHSISLTHLAEAYLLAGRINDAINIAVRPLTTAAIQITWVRSMGSPASREIYFTTSR
jgi:hypothetical protein